MNACRSLNSTSEDALDLLPHLSLSRWISRPLRDPSGSQPVARKHDSPFSACASVRNRSLIGTEKNHLCPVSRYSAPDPVRPVAGRAVVIVARRSDPPCFSVMAMPTVAPRFSPA